jgi:hypothetical protein
MVTMAEVICTCRRLDGNATVRPVATCPWERKMKALISVSVLGLIATGYASYAYAEDWMLRVQAMSRTCHVQPKTTASPLGDDLKGPFPSRKAACQEAVNLENDDRSDQSKCWSFGGSTISACKPEGIVLSPGR